MDNSSYELLRQLAQNPFVNLLGFVLGAIGVILAIVFYIRSLRYKSPRFEAVSKTIVENLRASLDGLEVRFNDVPQERITVTRIAFWNAGTETITSSDLTKLSPLQIIVPSGAQVLDANVVYETGKANRFAIKEIVLPQDENDPTAIRISFDYLDHNEGGIVQIVHSGESSHEIFMEGKIKGSRPVRRLESPAFRLRFLFPGPLRLLVTSTAFGWIGVIFYVALAVIGIIVPLLHPNYWYVVFLFPFGAVGAWGMYVAYSVEQIPRSLQKLD